MSEQQHSTAQHGTQQQAQAQAQARGGVGDGLQVRSGLACSPTQTQTGRQADKQTGRQADRQAGRQVGSAQAQAGSGRLRQARRSDGGWWMLVWDGYAGRAVVWRECAIEVLVDTVD